MSSLTNSVTQRNDGPEAGGPSLRERVRRAAKQLESDLIREALEQHRWNRRRTAEALNISYRSLMYKMKNCNLRSSIAAGVAKEEPETGCGD